MKAQMDLKLIISNSEIKREIIKKLSGCQAVLSQPPEYFHQVATVYSV